MLRRLNYRYDTVFLRLLLASFVWIWWCLETSYATSQVWLPGMERHARVGLVAGEGDGVKAWLRRELQDFQEQKAYQELKEWTEQLADETETAPLWVIVLATCSVAIWRVLRLRYAEGESVRQRQSRVRRKPRAGLTSPLPTSGQLTPAGSMPLQTVPGPTSSQSVRRDVPVWADPQLWYKAAGQHHGSHALPVWADPHVWQTAPPAESLPPPRVRRRRVADGTWPVWAATDLWQSPGQPQDT